MIIIIGVFMTIYRLARTLAACLFIAACGIIQGEMAAAQEASHQTISMSKTSEHKTDVAFIADVHLQDIYGHIAEYPGLANSQNQRQAVMRTMYSQLTSTRLFNENYFAFRAALEDIHRRGVRLVALPGDYTDNGQPINIDGLKVILDEFSAKGMRFFLAPGNHDPNGPCDDDGGAPDFLGAGGRNQMIYSPGSPACLNKVAAVTGTATPWTDGVVCSDQVEELGYAGIMQRLARFGYMPQADDLYWESPFSSAKSRASFSLEVATEEAELSHRQFEICYEGEGGIYKGPNYSHCSFVADASYLVEPVEGVWLLSIDANVFRPKAQSIIDHVYPNLSGSFDGSADAGYNLLLSHKQHLLPWITSVVARAKEQGKQLVTFSHFPLAEFYSDQSDRMSALFTPNAFQMQRRPQLATTQALAKTGLTLHVGGHMHLNNTGVYSPSGSTGDFLVNIQSPSLGVFGAAYKLITLRQDLPVEVQTVALERVPRFDELFEHYEEEWRYLSTSASQKDHEHLWDHRILSSKDYLSFTHFYFGELARLRFLNDYWPCSLRQVVTQFNAAQLLVLSQFDPEVTLAQLSLLPGGLTAASCDSGSVAVSPIIDKVQLQLKWAQAQEKAEHLASEAGFSLGEVATLSAYDIYGDFHRTVYAGPFAFKHMSPEKIKIYDLLFKAFEARPEATQEPLRASNTDKPNTAVGPQVKELMAIFSGLLHGHPSDHFMIDVVKHTVTAVAD